MIMGMDTWLPESRRRVGYLPENPTFYDYLSAEEYIEFVGSQFCMDKAQLAQSSEDVLKRLELWRPASGLYVATAKGWCNG
jgi:ABC-2 type transport system ATP-binding protein